MRAAPLGRGHASSNYHLTPQPSPPSSPPPSLTSILACLPSAYISPHQIVPVAARLCLPQLLPGRRKRSTFLFSEALRRLRIAS